MEARTGVHLDITAVSMFSVLEQFSLMVTSGDYSDMIEGAITYYNGGSTKAIEDGFLLDLVNMLDEMPNYAAWIDSNPSYRGDIMTLNGEIAYAACFSETERNVGPQLRGDWLEELGLELPETYDDYHDVLTAFKENYGAGLWLDAHGTQRNNVLSAGYDVHVNNQDIIGGVEKLLQGGRVPRMAFILLHTGWPRRHRMDAVWDDSVIAQMLPSAIMAQASWISSAQSVCSQGASSWVK